MLSETAANIGRDVHRSDHCRISRGSTSLRDSLAWSKDSISIARRWTDRCPRTLACEHPRVMPLSVDVSWDPCRHPRHLLRLRLVLPPHGPGASPGGVGVRS